MSMPDSGVYAQPNSHRKIAAHQDPKSAFVKRRKTDLSVDEDAHDYVPTPKPKPKPKPKPVTTARPAWPVDDDDEGDGTFTVASEPAETPQGPSPAGLAALTTLPLSAGQRAVVIDAYTRCRASDTSWNFVLRRDTHRTVLGLREVLWAEAEAARADEKESPSEVATLRWFVAGHAYEKWVKYVGEYRKRLNGKKLSDFDPADPMLEKRQRKEAWAELPVDDPTLVDQDEELEQDEEQDEVTDKPRKSGPPEGVGPKRTAAERAAERASKKVDVSKLPGLKPVTSRQIPAVFTKKWTGRGGYTGEWVYSVLEAVTPVGERSLSPMQQLLGQLSYWEEPLPTGEPRRSAEHRRTIDRVEWFETSISDMAKFFRWPPRMVGTALDRLVDVGLVDRKVMAGKYGPHTSYTRVKWEVVHHLLAVAKVMKPHEVRQPKAKGRESKRSRKEG